MQRGDNGAILPSWNITTRNALKIVKFADKGPESAVKSTLTSIWLHKQEQCRAAKSETPRARAAPSAAQGHAKASRCLRTWTAKRGHCPFGKAGLALSRKDLSLVSCHKHNEQISAEAWARTTPPGFIKKFKWRWFLNPFSFSFLLQIRYSGLVPTSRQSRTHVKSVFLPLSLFAVFIITNRRS